MENKTDSQPIGSQENENLCTARKWKQVNRWSTQWEAVFASYSPSRGLALVFSERLHCPTFSPQNSSRLASRPLHKPMSFFEHTFVFCHNKIRQAPLVHPLEFITSPGGSVSLTCRMAFRTQELGAKCAHGQWDAMHAFSSTVGKVRKCTGKICV